MDNTKNQKLPAATRNNYVLELTKNEVLVKWSEFNGFKTKMTEMFAREYPNCIFARVLYVGPQIVDKTKLVPGKIVVIPLGVGEKLAGLSLVERCDYIIVRETDIVFHSCID